MGAPHGEAAQIKQMQSGDESEGGARQRTRLFLPLPLV